MGQVLGFARSWWGQVFVLLAIIAVLDKAGGFAKDVGASTNFVSTTIKDLKV